MRIEMLACDRCGDTSTVPVRTAWARVYAARRDLADLVGTAETPADLCATCSAGLVDWLIAGRPSAPAQPPRTAQARERRGDLALAAADCGAFLDQGRDQGCPADDPDWLEALEEIR